MALIQPTLADPISPDEFQRQAAERVTPLGSYLEAKALGGLEAARPVEAFELGSLPSRYAADEYGLMPPGPPPADLMTKEQFDASPHARPGLEWEEGETEARAAARAAVHDRQAYRDSLIARSDAGPLGQAAGFGLGLGAAALDPTNYIPLIGPASRAAMVARFGRIGGALLMHGTEAAANTALFEPLAAETARVQGRSYGWEDAGADILINALGGAFLGTAVGAGARAWRRRRAGNDRLASPDISRVPPEEGAALTPAEEDALRGYKDLGYLNQRFRAEGKLAPADVPKAEAQAATLDAALAKSRLEQDTTVYRGIATGERSGDPAAMVGKELPASNFQSATTDRELGLKYAGRDQEGGGGVLLEVKVPAGSRGAWLDQYAKEGRPAENELLLPRDGSFKVTAARREGNVTVLTGDWQDATAAAPAAAPAAPPEIGASGHEFTKPITDATGKPIGRIEGSIGPAEYQVSHAEVNSGKGQGHAVRAYAELADHVLADGKRLVSDSDVTLDAARVYEGLQRRGYTVERTPSAELFTEGGHSTWRTPDGEPVFSVTAGPKAAPPEAGAGVVPRRPGQPPLRVDDLMRRADGANLALDQIDRGEPVDVGKLLAGDPAARAPAPVRADPAEGRRGPMSTATAAPEPAHPSVAEAAPRVGKTGDELAIFKEDARLEGYEAPLPGHEPKPEPGSADAAKAENAKPGLPPTPKEQAVASAALPPELQEVEAMRREGTLAPADEATLAAGEKEAQQAEGYATAYETLLNCVLRNV